MIISSILYATNRFSAMSFVFLADSKLLVSSEIMVFFLSLFLYRYLDSCFIFSLSLCFIEFLSIFYFSVAQGTLGRLSLPWIMPSSVAGASSLHACSHLPLSVFLFLLRCWFCLFPLSLLTFDVGSCIQTASMY